MRKWPPRLSFRLSAARAISQPTVTMLVTRRSIGSHAREHVAAAMAARHPAFEIGDARSSARMRSRSRPTARHIDRARRARQGTASAIAAAAATTGPTSGVSKGTRGRRARHRRGRPGAEHEPLEQRVAGQPVGPVHAGACHLASGEQCRNRRAAVEIGFDATHHVVRRRADGNPIARQVQTGLRARAARSSEIAAGRTRDRGAPSSGKSARRYALPRGRWRARPGRERPDRRPARTAA